MRILFISGYAPWNKISQKKMASHHLYGMNELIDEYIKENGNLKGIIKNEYIENSSVDFYLWKPGKKKIFLQLIDLYKKRKQYDLYYDSLNRCSLYLGFLKKMGLFKTKILTVMHHPPYNMQLRYSLSDGYVFFDENYKKLAIDSCPKNIKKYYVNEWYPDVKWYKNFTSNNVINKGFFIDNGKSRRDHDILIKAANELRISTSIANDGENYTNSNYVKFYSINLEEESSIIKILMEHKVIVIPIEKDIKKEKIGPLGITSFLDAIALGMPVIASDNVCFAHLIKDKKLGLLYKTGDYNSLKKALFNIYTNESEYQKYKQNMKNFSKTHTVECYGENLIKIIKNIM